MSDSAVPRKAPIKPPVPARPPGTLPTAPSGRMSLEHVVSGRLVKPIRVLLYGLEGVGKSTFAAGAPNPIFLGAEDGTSELDVERFPQPQTWPEVIEAVDELRTAEHDYKTLVIDTLDWVEPLCWAHLCATWTPDGRKTKVKNIEDYGFGKGYNEAGGLWRVLISRLERLREQRRMDMVLLAHSWIRTFKNPMGGDYDRFEMKLHKIAAGIWREWCDAVVFAAHDITTYEDGRRIKGIGTGARILHTQHNAVWDAKNRYDLPPSLPLDWNAFAEAVRTRRPDDPARLRTQIERLLGEVAANTTLMTRDATLTTRVRNSVANAGDNADELARILNKLAAKIETTPTDEEASQ